MLVQRRCIEDVLNVAVKDLSFIWSRNIFFFTNLIVVSFFRSLLDKRPPEGPLERGVLPEDVVESRTK